MSSADRIVVGVTVFALCWYAGASPLAQRQAPPSFKAGVDGVRLDVRVVAGDGSFVRDITKDDLRVFEDGQEQTIAAFSKVEIPLPAATAGPVPATDVSSNVSFRDGRAYLLLLDDLSVHPQREVMVRQLARRFIERYTAPEDRVAIATTSGIGSGTQDFTNSRTDLFRAIDQFKGRTLPEAAADTFPGLAEARAAGPPNAPPPEVRPTDVLPLQWLLTSVEWLGTVPDRRKALVFISEGVLDQSPDKNVESFHLDIRAAASRGNVAIYSVEAVGLPNAPSGAVKPVVVVDDEPISEQRRRLQAGLTRLSDETGGVAAVRTNAFDALFERVVADSSAYYLLGYTSTHGASRKPRRLEVRVNRPGLKAQVRQSYGTPSGNMSKRTAPPAGLPPALGEAFQSPVPITEIELAVTTAARRGSGDRASVAVVVEGRGERQLDLFMGAADGSGKMQAFQRGALKPASSGAGDAMMQATARFDLKPGRYHLRVAALQEETGVRGSVQHDFQVPDFSKEDLSISGVTLVDVKRGRTPTTRRTFAQSESIDVAAEVYWKRGMTQPISVVTRVTSSQGDVVYEQGGVVEPNQRPDRGVDLGLTIPLQRHPPGAYQLIVEVRTSGDKPLSARRELPFVVSAR
jgi:VWFA-related protein